MVKFSVLWSNFLFSDFSLTRLRKALTTQLHSLRQELGPKEESLMRVTEKLQETDREYELSLQAIAEKEKSLGQKSENLNLLQKQVCTVWAIFFNNNMS